MPIRIILAGPRGKMGQEAIQMIETVSDFHLAAVIDHKNDGNELKDIIDGNNAQTPVYENPEICFQEIEADVFIDLTTPNSGYKHTKLAINHNIRGVIGTSGFTEKSVNELKEIADGKGLGCIIAPNFAIGAVLMMKFSKMAAVYFPDVEIIEKHHDH